MEDGFARKVQDPENHAFDASVHDALAHYKATLTRASSTRLNSDVLCQTFRVCTSRRAINLRACAALALIKKGAFKLS